MVSVALTCLVVLVATVSVWSRAGGDGVSTMTEASTFVFGSTRLFCPRRGQNADGPSGECEAAARGRSRRSNERLVAGQTPRSAEQGTELQRSLRSRPEFTSALSELRGSVLLFPQVGADEDEDEGAATYENVGDASASV